MQIETIKIVSNDFDGGFVVINKEDFDPKTQVEFTGQKPTYSPKRN